MATKWQAELNESVNEVAGELFDVHCHLTDPRVRGRADELLERARRAGVRDVMLAGVDQDDWQAQIAFAARHPQVRTCFGLHPQVVPELDDASIRSQLDALAVAVAGSDRPAAIGELGLDRAVAPADSVERQTRVFREQLALARDVNLPVVLHILRAQDAALRVLERDGLPAAGGIVHSYSGSAELVPRYVKLGLHLSFAGAVTYPNARRVKEAAAAVPDEWLLAETDAPDQTPQPHRPAENEPAFLRSVIAALAEARGTTTQQIAALCTRNARALLPE